MISPKTLQNARRLGLVLAAGAALLVFPALADVLELTNGDHYSGTIISMTRSNVEFQSEIQGLVKLPRDKVAKMTLHESVTTKSAAKPAVQGVIPSAAHPAKAA